MVRRGVTPSTQWAKENARMKFPSVREAIAEFFGTMVLAIFSFCGSAMMLNYDVMWLGAIGGFMGILAGIIVFGGVSGGHINPAVTLALVISGYKSWLYLPIYWFCQFFGAYIGAVIGYAMFEARLRRLLGDPILHPEVANIFSSTPPNIAIGTGLLVEIVASFIFVAIILACVDYRNMRVQKQMIPIFIATIAYGLALTMPPASFNPALNFSPRLSALSIGWNVSDVFNNVIEPAMTSQEWWCVGLFGPFVGAILASVFYIFTVAPNVDEDDDENAGYHKKLVANPNDHEVGEWRSNRFNKPQSVSHYEGHINPSYAGPEPTRSPPPPAIYKDPRQQRTPPGYETHY